MNHFIVWVLRNCQFWKGIQEGINNQCTMELNKFHIIVVNRKRKMMERVDKMLSFISIWQMYWMFGLFVGSVFSALWHILNEIWLWLRLTADVLWHCLILAKRISFQFFNKENWTESVRLMFYGSHDGFRFTATRLLATDDSNNKIRKKIQNSIKFLSRKHARKLFNYSIPCESELCFH